jgi:hypothetical protein
MKTPKVTISCTVGSITLELFSKYELKLSNGVTDIIVGIETLEELARNISRLKNAYEEDFGEDSVFEDN